MAEAVLVGIAPSKRHMPIVRMSRLCSVEGRPAILKQLVVRGSELVLSTALTQWDLASRSGD